MANGSSAPFYATRTSSAWAPFRLKVQVPEALTQGSPFPAQGSLNETAVMPQQADESTAIWRIK